MPYKCIECKETRASFGYKWEEPTHCVSCKEDDMKNVRTKMCIKCSKVSPSYGYIAKQPTHCAKCKEPNMQNVTGKLCKKCGKSRPRFGVKKRTHCAKCKEPNMTDLEAQKCLKCKKLYPSYGYEMKHPIYCADCKLPSMKNVVSRRCEKCHIRHPCYGYTSAIRCSRCKIAGMKNVVTKMCKKCNETVPVFGYDKATRCFNCKEPDMTDVCNKRCNANNLPHKILCPMVGSRNYNGFCTHCFAHLFPEHPKTANIRKKSKELKVVSYISSKNKGFLHDKPLYVDLNGSNCPSKRRIDLRKLINGTLLCIEVDEEQRSYHLEEGRYHDLFMDFSGKYIFIRYNPDAYRDTKGKKRNPQFNTRMKILEEQILLHTNRINSDKNEDLLEIHYLFYNEDKQPVLHSKNLSCLEE
jgi:hypothetical protein